MTFYKDREYTRCIVIKEVGPFTEHLSYTSDNKENAYFVCQIMMRLSLVLST